MIRDQLFQYLTDPRELPEDIRDSLETPVVRAIIALGFAAEAGFSLQEEDWITQGLMNDFERGGIPPAAQTLIVDHVMAEP